MTSERGFPVHESDKAPTAVPRPERDLLYQWEADGDVAVANSNKKGATRERELVNWLDGDGWAVIRAPASGSATQRELPDVLAGNADRFYAIEAKASGGDPIYYDEEEVEALLFFASNFGATALLGARYDETHGDPSYGEDWPGWYFFPPEDAHQTPNMNYRAKKERAETHGIPITEL